MHHRFSVALASALLFGSALHTACAVPLHPSRPEVLKADLDGQIKPDEMSVVVIMPVRCEERGVASLCAQFGAHQAPAGSYVYLADSRIAHRRSVEGQVQALPAALKERRYVMLIDWQYISEKSGREQLPGLNGESVVYDLTAKKIVWHGIVLHTSTMEKIGSLAGDYIEAAINQVGGHANRLHELAERGIGIRDLGGKPDEGTTPNLVIFNRRYDRDFWTSPDSVWLTLASAAEPSRKLYFGMPPDSYLAFSMPPGKYEIDHGIGNPAVLEVGAKPLSYRLTRGRAARGDRMEEVPAGKFDAERLAARNLLLPDSEAGILRRLGGLGWSDIPAEADMPASMQPQPAVPAAARPNRSKRPYARMRLVGLTGLDSEIIPNSGCYRTKSALENVGNLLGGAVKTLAKPRSSFGLSLLGPVGALIDARKEDKNVRIGMKDTPATRSLDKAGNWVFPAYVHEMEVAAGSPVTVKAVYLYRTGTHEGRCRVAGSFVPEAGADYETTFRHAGDECYAHVNEIDAVDGGEAMVAVPLTRAEECLDPQK